MTRQNDPDKLLKTAEEIVEATGLSDWQVSAIKRFTKDTPTDTPFVGGKYTTKKRILDWFFAHPSFVATHQLTQKKAPERTATDPRPSTADRSDGRFAKRVQRRTSPVELEPQLAQVG